MSDNTYSSILSTWSATDDYVGAFMIVAGLAAVCESAAEKM